MRVLLTYLGEGTYKVWHSGRVFEDAEIYPFVGNVDIYVAGKKIKPDWAARKSDPQSTWWVQVKLGDKKIGWTKETKNFGNMDSCS